MDLRHLDISLPDPHFYVPGTKTRSTLAQILNDDELVRLSTVSGYVHTANRLPTDHMLDISKGIQQYRSHRGG